MPTCITNAPGHAGGGGSSGGAPQTTEEGAAQAFAKRDQYRKEVKNTKKSQLNRMAKKKLAEFIRKAIAAVATSPAQVLTKSIQFERKLMTSTKDTLLKTARDMKGMIQ